MRRRAGLLLRSKPSGPDWRSCTICRGPANASSAGETSACSCVLTCCCSHPSAPPSRNLPIPSCCSGTPRRGSERWPSTGTRTRQRAYEKLRELSPGTAEVHAGLGLIYFQQRKFAEAVPALRQALKLNPALPRTDILLAMCLSELGQYKEALPGLRKGFKQTADDPLRHMTGLQLQRAYTGLEQDAQAVEVALELTRLYPKDPEVLYHSGRLFSNYAYLTTMKLAAAGARLRLDASGGGRSQREPGALRPGDPRVPGRCWRRTRAGPGSTSGSAVPSWRGRRPRARRRGRALRGWRPSRSSRRSSRSIPRTRPPPTSWGRSTARRASSTKAAELFGARGSALSRLRGGADRARARVLIALGSRSRRCPICARPSPSSPRTRFRTTSSRSSIAHLGNLAEQQKALASSNACRARRPREAEPCRSFRETSRSRSWRPRQYPSRPAPATSATIGGWSIHETEEIETVRSRANRAGGAVPGRGCGRPCSPRRPVDGAGGTPEAQLAAARPADGVQGEPGRHRRAQAPAELADPGARARRHAIGLPGPRGADPRRPAAAAADLVWDSGRVASDESTQRAYDGQALRSGQRYHWQVRVWDGARQGLRLERPALLGDGTARRGGLEGELDRARTFRRTSRRPAPRPCCAASSS